MAKKKFPSNLHIENYRWLLSQASIRGISMNAVLNELINEKRSQNDIKTMSSLASRRKVN